MIWSELISKAWDSQTANFTAREYGKIVSWRLKKIVSNLIKMAFNFREQNFKKARTFFLLLIKLSLKKVNRRSKQKNAVDQAIIFRKSVSTVNGLPRDHPPELKLNFHHVFRRRTQRRKRTRKSCATRGSKKSSTPD